MRKEKWSTAFAIFLLRVVSGFILMEHGGVKLFGFFGGLPQVAETSTLLTMLGSIEFFGGILILLGLFTRLTASIASLQMAAAYFLAHASLDYWYAPMLNQGEPALLLSLIFLIFASGGAGKWSMDNVIHPNPQDVH